MAMLTHIKARCECPFERASRNYRQLPRAGDRCHQPRLRRSFGFVRAAGAQSALAATGSLVATALMGLIGYLLSYQAMFVISATLALPLLVALAAIRATDIDFARARGAP
jgi:hypothetical protein